MVDVRGHLFLFLHKERMNCVFSQNLGWQFLIRDLMQLDRFGQGFDKIPNRKILSESGLHYAEFYRQVTP